MALSNLFGWNKNRSRQPPQRAVQPAEQRTSRRRNPQHAEQPAERQISRRRNPQHAGQPAERQISRKRNPQRAERPAAQQTNSALSGGSFRRMTPEAAGRPALIKAARRFQTSLSEQNGKIIPVNQNGSSEEKVYETVFCFSVAYHR